MTKNILNILNPNCKIKNTAISANYVILMNFLPPTIKLQQLIVLLSKRGRKPHKHKKQQKNNWTKQTSKLRLIASIYLFIKVKTILVKQLIEITLQENLWSIIMCIG